MGGFVVNLLIWRAGGEGLIRERRRGERELVARSLRLLATNAANREAVVLIVVVRVQIRRIEVQVVAVSATVLSRRPIVAVATHIVPTRRVEVAAVNVIIRCASNL